MPDSPIDPASLEGDALTRWYQRSPAEVEQERQAAEAQRYNAFFGRGGDTDPDPGFSSGFELPSQEIDPGFTREGGRRYRTSIPDLRGFPQVQTGGEA